MGTLLESIHSPADLKRLTYAQMAELAEEIREFLIQTLSKTGGHLGPNLGVVELDSRPARRLQHARGQDPLRRQPPGLHPQDAHRPPRPL